MSLGVGISENVILQNAQLDDKNWLTITFRQLQETEFNPFAALSSNEVEEKPKTDIDIKIFNPKVPDATDRKGNTRTEQQIVDMIQNDVNRTKGVLLHLAEGYLTKDQIDFSGMYDGTGMDADNFNQKLRDQAVLTLIHKNMCIAWINMVKPFLGDEQYKFRLLLLRTSKDKHFATFRDKYIKENPFWESMEIPATASKVKFSAYELTQGLNDGTPTARSEADKPKADDTPVEATSVFGG